MGPAALFAVGSSGLVSTAAEVNDAATANLMPTLQEALAAGSDVAEAVAAMRCTAAGDPLAEGTAAAFLALGS